MDEKKDEDKKGKVNYCRPKHTPGSEYANTASASRSNQGCCVGHYRLSRCIASSGGLLLGLGGNWVISLLLMYVSWVSLVTFGVVTDVHPPQSVHTVIQYVRMRSSSPAPKVPRRMRPLMISVEYPPK